MESTRLTTNQVTSQFMIVSSKAVTINSLSIEHYCRTERYGRSKHIYEVDSTRSWLVT
jgi:hypothetical protein